MTHLNSFEVGHYRGIDGVSLPHLSRANLITGANGIGKTALIEAMWLFTGRDNSHLWWNANVQRSRDDVVDPISELTKDIVKLSGTEDGELHKVEVKFERHVGSSDEATAQMPAELAQLPVAGQLRSRIDDHEMQGERMPRPTPAGLVLHTVGQLPNKATCIIEGTGWIHDAHGELLVRYSELVKNGHKEDLKNAMSLILPKIEDIEILTNREGRSYLSAVVSSDTRLPLKDLGGGIVRLFKLYLSLFSARNGIVLFDEVENGIHYSVLQTLWDRVRLWMDKWNVQVVATTHSAECIDAAIEAFEEKPTDLSIHQLFVGGESGNLEVTTFTGDTLQGARELGLEIR